MCPSFATRFNLFAVATLWLSLVTGLTSCGSLKFNRDFKAAAKAPPQEGVLGAWSGTWASRVNGHQGKLQCLVTAPANPNEPHQFRYRATWMRVLSGTFSAQHSVEPQGLNQSAFSGEHRMPNWAGGLYSYQGKIIGDAFHATYDCSMDRGDYRMNRVSAKTSLETQSPTSEKKELHEH